MSASRSMRFCPRNVLARMDKLSEHKRNVHRLILHVNTNDPAAMNLALNNATNVTQYCRGLGEKVKIELITFGPDLHMLREDASPVKARVETMALISPEVSFKACGNTQENMHKAVAPCAAFSAIEWPALFKGFKVKRDSSEWDTVISAFTSIKLPSSAKRRSTDRSAATQAGNH
jgi:intracellular sulfur oxidation DsrE/DsrF family protein